MARLNRILIAGSLVASTFAGSTAQACWLTGCGGAPRTTFYAPVAVANPCNTCAPANPCATGTCGTSTFAQPTVAMMPVTQVTAFRPAFGGGLFAGSPNRAVVTTVPVTAGFAPVQQTVGFAPIATPAWSTAPYTSFRPVAVMPTSMAVPATFSAPVVVQSAPVSQATFFAPSTTTMPTTTFMPTTTVMPAPATSSAPGCNCQSSTTVPSTSSQFWTPNSSTTVVSAAPITSGTVTSSTVTNGPVTNGTTTSSGAVMTSGSTSTFGNSNLGSQGVIQQSAPQQTPANTDNNVKPIEDPIKKSSTTTPSYEDPNNKTALVPLWDNSQVVETKTNNAPMVRSLEELAPFNPVRMTSHVR